MNHIYVILYYDTYIYKCSHFCLIQYRRGSRHTHVAQNVTHCEEHMALECQLRRMLAGTLEFLVQALVVPARSIHRIPLSANPIKKMVKLMMLGNVSII